MKDAIGIFYIENGKTRGIDNWENQEGTDIIYEVIRVIEGKVLFYESHYDRMVNSCILSNTEFKMTKYSLKKDIELLIESNKVREGNLKITFKSKEKVLRIFCIKHSYPTTDMYKLGVKTILYYGERTNPNAKIINNNFRKDVQDKIEEKNAFEAILVNKDNNITEGSKSNIFLIKDEILFTSRVELVLPGVTRTEIINVAKKNNIKVCEGNVNADTIEEFDALFISGTSPNILPISDVNDIKYNINHKLLRQLMILFEDTIKRQINV
ncbi:aminotransferase class IV [Clostridium vincentii]|uniref:D-alanine aminotransferase n=1 Tax=Clostridium vincentii TaxID=52704 RepID=A0A2T0BG18_9CLOT|nr:aminotransferase class IV [Clostridium vincentii]PRR82819.1 D-alanine aminotransferase [Clostridium vincentii]